MYGHMSKEQLGSILMAALLVAGDPPPTEKLKPFQILVQVDRDRIEELRSALTAAGYDWRKVRAAKEGR